MTDTFQFYPTGVQLAAKAWGKFQRPVRHVCDPSAGKGHLFRHAKEGFPGVPDENLAWVAAVEDREIQEGRFKARLRDYARRRYADLREISAIEIDWEHHADLRSLGAKIIGHDFMQVQSLATVSHIIMNPPFAQGCKHVLHAWDCIYDAEIVAIINAETLRNPYTQERQRLVHLIQSHGSVEFIQNAFSEGVERSADVDVALIYLEKVPDQYMNVNNLLGSLKRDRQPDDIGLVPCSALALPDNFIQDTCFRFEQAVDATRIACEATALANKLSAGLGMTLDEMQAKGVGSDFREIADPVRNDANAAFKTRYDDLKKRAWGQVLRSTLLNDKLSNQARRKMEASAQDIYDLQFTAANIHGFFYREFPSPWATSIRT